MGKPLGFNIEEMIQTAEKEKMMAASVK